MNQEFEDELTPDERQAFAGLPREKVPPPQLEERVVQSLEQSGFISPPQKLQKPHAARITMAVAASLLFFVLGAAAMKWFSGPAPASNSPEFMLVLRQTNLLPQASAEEELRIAKEYGNWARQLSQQGVLADGEKLKDEVRVLSFVDGRPVTSPQSANPGGTNIAGYFLIKAQTYDQAIKVAEGCPHLKYGGTIEVREIDRF